MFFNNLVSGKKELQNSTSVYWISTGNSPLLKIQGLPLEVKMKSLMKMKIEMKINLGESFRFKS